LKIVNKQLKKCKQTAENVNKQTAENQEFNDL
jgi:hypothetical protein